MDSEDEHIFEEEKRKRKDGVRLVELICEFNHALLPFESSGPTIVYR